MAAEGTNCWVHWGDITGETKDERFPGCSDVISWEWGVTGSLETKVGTDSKKGTPSPGKIAVFKIKKPWDKASCVLMYRCFRPFVFPEVVMAMRTDAGKSGPLTTLWIKLYNVVISNFEPNGSEQGVVTEDIDLRFDKIEVQYQLQDEKGKGKGVVEQKLEVLPDNWE